MERISKIGSPDQEAKAAAHERWNRVAKPLGSLGLLEDVIEKIAAIQETAEVDISRRAVAVMCADNGVVCEGVTQSGSDVTAICAYAIADGKSNINALAGAFNADVFAVDIGIKQEISHPQLQNKRIANGTGNIAAEPAMSLSQTENAISVGIDTVRDLSSKGYKIIVSGEMGIGNTTTSAAVASAILGLPPRETAGRGAGLDSAGLERKIAVIERALALHKPDANAPVELISKIGGFDIAGMTGLFLGGAIYKIPVVIDGVISAAAACLACKIAPKSREYMLASHTSCEPSGAALLREIGLEAPINARLRLGEGTGGVLLLPLLDGALSVYYNAHKFDELGIEGYTELK